MRSFLIFLLLSFIFTVFQGLPEILFKFFFFTLFYNLNFGKVDFMMLINLLLWWSRTSTCARSCSLQSSYHRHWCGSRSSVNTNRIPRLFSGQAETQSWGGAEEESFWYLKLDSSHWHFIIMCWTKSILIRQLMLLTRFISVESERILMVSGLIYMQLRGKMLKMVRHPSLKEPIGSALMTSREWQIISARTIHLGKEAMARY